MKKLVCHISLSLGGGVGSVIKNLINYQKLKGYECAFIYLSNLVTNEEIEMLKAIDEHILLIKIERSLYKGKNIVFGMEINKIYKEVKNKYKNYKIIFHAHNLASIGLIPKIKKVPIICTVHGRNATNNKLSEVITNTILKRLKLYNKYITFVSNETLNQHMFLNKYKNIKVIKNGAYINYEPYNGIIKGENDFILGYCAYVKNAKGWRFIVNALKYIKSDNIKLVIVGKGTSCEINELKKEIYINKNIVYLGQINNASGKVMKYFDLLILPSETEGLPMSIIEAMANGVPVLATKVGGIPEILKENYNGYFIERDAEDISGKIKRIYHDKELQNTLKANSLKTYEEEFTLEHMGIEYDKLYNKI